MGGVKLTLRVSSVQSLAAHRLRIAGVAKESRIVYYFDVGRRENAKGKDRTDIKHGKMGKNQTKEGRIRKLCTELVSAGTQRVAE